MTMISLQKCTTYSRDVLEKKIESGLMDIGFDCNLFRNARVALKPNLLISSPPEDAVITHPEIFRAVARIVKKYKGKPILLESPAFTALRSTLDESGYREIIDSEGISVPADNETIILNNWDGEYYKQFEIIKSFMDVDILLNLPKFKTHGLTHITGAVKNLFGSIPGKKKSQWHFKARTREEFSGFLLDLYGAFIAEFNTDKRILHIMDAIVAMEGEGPGPLGNPKKIGALLIGENAIALDYIIATIAGLDINNIPTIFEGMRRYPGFSSPEQIKLIGSDIEGLICDNFVPSRSSIRSQIFRWPLTSDLFRNLFVQKPYPQEKKCTRCFNCMAICPNKAISKPEKKHNKQGVPVFNYKKCIRCYCCVEICPEAALQMRKGKLQWLLGI